jgi:hypothetical protein
MLQLRRIRSGVEAPRQQESLEFMIQQRQKSVS